LKIDEDFMSKRKVTVSVLVQPRLNIDEDFMSKKSYSFCTSIVLLDPHSQQTGGNTLFFRNAGILRRRHRHLCCWLEGSPRR
jgi:hypothetical protein